MGERVVVTGLGIVSSLGHAIDDFWPSLIQGKSGISKVVSFDTSRLERNCGGEIKNFNAKDLIAAPNISSLPRTHQFALVACHKALKDAGISQPGGVGLALGSIVSGVEFVEEKNKNPRNYPAYMCAANVCKILKLNGSVFTLSGACAAGNYAIALAYDRIRCGKEEVVIAAGADYFALGTFVGFYRVFSLAPEKCQPFDKNRRGVIPAEGAGALIIESLSSAKKRNARIYAEVLGYGMSSDAFHPLIPSLDGVTRCMENALENAHLIPKDIDYINAHGTGTIPNDKTECGAIKKLFGKKLYKKIPVSSIKSMLGHAMGAASSMEAIACCLTLKNGVIPPTINYETPDPDCDIDCVPNKARAQKVKIVLNNSFGFGGMNCSLVFSAY